MPAQDAERWDARYEHDPRYSSYQEPRPFLREHSRWLPEQGLAIDLAMGLGGNSSFLLERGLRVIGVDISHVAVRRAKSLFPGLQVVQADLTRFYLPAGRFDVLLNFFYLERSLWPAYMRALKPGGLLVFETLTIGMLSLQPGVSPEYLLAEGELQGAFPELETLAYWEGWQKSRSGRPRATAALLARKPQD